MIRSMTLQNISLGMLLCVASHTASAASVSYYLDTNNVGLAQTNYLQVTISDGLVVGDIDFSVQTLPAFDALNPGNNFGMQSFSLNFDRAALSIGAANITNLSPNAWSFSLTESNVSQYGRFDINATGNGSTRTDLLSFTISGVAGDSINSYASTYSDIPGNSGNPPQLFAAHVAGFDSNGAASGGVTSGYFAGSSLAVPVPAAVWLFGGGLIALAGLLNRKK